MALLSLLRKFKLKGLPLRAEGSGPALPKRSQKSQELTDPTKFGSAGMQARAIAARINEELRRDWEETQRRRKLYNRLTAAAACAGFGAALVFVSCLVDVVLEEDCYGDSYEDSYED